MPEITYPLDTSGRAITNLITNELHTVSEANFRDYFFIVPNFAPFYINGFVLKFHLNGEQRILTEGIDYSFALPYIAGTRSVGIPLYGAITLNNLNIAGILECSYQCLGGQWVANRLYVLQYLAEKAYNPRTTIWDTVTNKPEIFAPTPHYQDYATFYGQEEFVAAIGRVADAIAASRPELAFIDYITNHPPTPADIGLGNIVNLPLATDAEVAARLPVDKYITLRQMLSLLESSYIQKVYSVVANKLDFFNTEDAYFTFDTIGIPPGKTFYWRIEHITTTRSDFINDNGSVVSDADGRISFRIPFSSTFVRTDALMFRVQIRLGGVNGTLLVTSTTLTVRYGREENLQNLITGSIATLSADEFITAAYLYSTVDVDLSSEQKKMPLPPSPPVLSLHEYISDRIINPLPTVDITAAYLYNTIDVDDSSDQHRTPVATVLSLHEYIANNIIKPVPVNDITAAYLYNTIGVDDIVEQYRIRLLLPVTPPTPVLSLGEYVVGNIIKPVPVNDITAAYLYNTIDVGVNSKQLRTLVIPPIALPVTPSIPVLNINEYITGNIIKPVATVDITAAYLYSAIDVGVNSNQLRTLVIPPVIPPIIPPTPVLNLDEYIANNIIKPVPVNDITASYLYSAIDVGVNSKQLRTLVIPPPVLTDGTILDQILNTYYLYYSDISASGIFLQYQNES